MIKWIDPKLRLPPQGKKILYFDKGDIYIVQRYDDMWVPIPFVDSKFAFTGPPQLWAEFNFPEGFFGKTKIFKEEEFIDFDTFQIKYPDEYEEFIYATRLVWKKQIKGK